MPLDEEKRVNFRETVLIIIDVNWIQSYGTVPIKFSKKLLSKKKKRKE